MLRQEHSRGLGGARRSSRRAGVLAVVQPGRAHCSVASYKHSAAGQALGYVYQVGWGLLELARPGPEDFELRLETIDDVSWHDAAGDPLTALQVKHHVGAGRLTDASPDLWRTVGVWLDDPVLLDPEGPTLVLATTQAVGEGTALSFLGPDGRQPSDALDLLDEMAKTSTNDSTRTVRDGWLRLPDAVRAGVCERAMIVSEQGPADRLADRLRDVLLHALPIGQEDLFVRLLLGWWWGTAVDMLAGARSGASRVQLRLQLDDLREQFSPRSLPVTVGVDGLPESADADRERTFARQLDWVDAGDELLLAAVRDYYRAYAQTQDWVENHLVGLAELDRYERRVVDEWTFQFELMRQALGQDASDDQMKRAGMRLYGLVMNQPAGMMRPGLNEPFYGRGTHHRLADDGQVGWHPDFRDRLEQLLAGRVA